MDNNMNNAFGEFGDAVKQMANNAFAISKNIVNKVLDTLTTTYQNMTEDFRIDKIIDVYYLKNYYRRKSGTAVLIANVGSLLRYSPSNEKLKKVSNMKDEYIIAEYSESTEMVIQTDFIHKDKISNNIMDALNANNGIIILKD